MRKLIHLGFFRKIKSFGNLKLAFCHENICVSNEKKCTHSAAQINNINKVVKKLHIDSLYFFKRESGKKYYKGSQ